MQALSSLGFMASFAREKRNYMKDDANVRMLVCVSARAIFTKKKWNTSPRRRVGTNSVAAVRNIKTAPFSTLTSHTPQS
jgi:hypothetical protein